MTVIINQTWGLGDIIFCQAIAWKYIQQGHKVLWPVESNFIEGLNRAYPEITFIDKNLLNIDYECREIRKHEEVLILPLRFADSIMNVQYKDCMRSKYLMAEMPLDCWKIPASFKRTWTNGSRLYEKLNPSKGEYNLISRFFGTNSQFVAPIKVNNGFTNIELCTIKGYSLFDWADLIEDASEIHAVSSSILYILELLDLKMPIHLYKREPLEHNFENVDYLFTKLYILH